MAKITVRLNTRGVDLTGMMAEANEQLSELADARWRITDVECFAGEDLPSKDGMMRLWSAMLTAEAEVSE